MHLVLLPNEKKKKKKKIIKFAIKKDTLKALISYSIYLKKMAKRNKMAKS